MNFFVGSESYSLLEKNDFVENIECFSCYSDGPKIEVEPVCTARHYVTGYVPHVREGFASQKSLKTE